MRRDGREYLVAEHTISDGILTFRLEDPAHRSTPARISLLELLELQDS